MNARETEKYAQLLYDAYRDALPGEELQPWLDLSWPHQRAWHTCAGALLKEIGYRQLINGLKEE